MRLCIIFLLNDVALNSRVVGRFTAMKWSTGCRQRLKKLSGGVQVTSAVCLVKKGVA